MSYSMHQAEWLSQPHFIFLNILGLIGEFKLSKLMYLVLIGIASKTPRSSARCRVFELNSTSFFLNILGLVCEFKLSKLKYLVLVDIASKTLRSSAWSLVFELRGFSLHSCTTTKLKSRSNSI